MVVKVSIETTKDYALIFREKRNELWNLIEGIKQFKLLFILFVFTSCSVYYPTNFRIKDLETGKYYYANTIECRDNCINFTEYNKNKTIRHSKTICKYKID